MFAREIMVNDVESILENGEIIKAYPDDKPYPRALKMGYAGVRPLHIVTARNNLDNSCIIITVYEPDALIWKDGFKNKTE